MKPLYNSILTSPHTMLAVLVDPDTHTEESLLQLIEVAAVSGPDLFLVGGSIITNGFFGRAVELLKQYAGVPVVIFPGNSYQVSDKADGILFLSLLSGRNPEYLIGQQVAAARQVRSSGIQVLPTGYILIDGGKVSATAFVTKTTPLPYHETDMAIATALAGELLGMQLIYLEAGSGALQHVAPHMVASVKKHLGIPLFVGGGIRTVAQAKEVAAAGADVIVVGNILEKDPGLLAALVAAAHSVPKTGKIR
jgi:geranylgeranylglyceryl phosphate synthase family protein